VKRYVREPIGQVKLSELRPVHIQAVYRSMEERGLSSRTIRYTHAVLSNALSEAVSLEVLFRNPASAVSLPRKVRKEMKAMTSEEVGRFLGAVSETRRAAVFTFALATNMRPQEYLALRWSDIDMQKKSATVRRAIIWRQEKGGGWHFGEPKTSGSRRTIPLPRSMVTALAEHKRRQGEERLKLGPNWQNYDLVFPTSVGTPTNISSLTNKWFKPALVKAELPTTFRLYDLRHTHATMLLADGESPKVVAERLGNSTIVLTLNTYSHVLPDMQARAAERTEKALFAATATL